MAAGIVSTVPAALLHRRRAAAAYSTVGMLQFIAPTLQFLLAVAVYDEPFTTRPRDRLRLHLDRAGALCLGAMVRDRRARPAARMQRAGGTLTRAAP